MPLMEVIESVANYPSQIIERVPEAGEGEIKWGAQLTVRDYQWAVFYRDGQALAVLEGGRHILTTQNIPILTKFVTQFGYGSDSPFRADVLFVERKLFPDIKWGTADPIVFRDPDFQLMRLRAFGTCAIRVIDPLAFVNNLVGARQYFDISDISDYVRQTIASCLSKTLGSLVSSIVDLPQKYDLISEAVVIETRKTLEVMGLEVAQVLINAINPPSAVQEIIDKRTSMSVIGDMNRFMQFQTATALETAAENSRGAGDGVGLGAGLGLGLMVPSAISQAVPSLSPSNQVGGGDIANRIRNLKALLDEGLIDEAIFAAKRAEILADV